MEKVQNFMKKKLLKFVICSIKIGKILLNCKQKKIKLEKNINIFHKKFVKNLAPNNIFHRKLS